MLVNQGKYLDAQRLEGQENGGYARSIASIGSRNVSQPQERAQTVEMAGLIQAMQEDDGETVAALSRQLGLPRLHWLFALSRLALRFYGGKILVDAVRCTTMRRACR